jgi:hypothetical protein
MVRPSVFHARPNNLSRVFLRRNLRWETRLSHPPRLILEARRELKIHNFDHYEHLNPVRNLELFEPPTSFFSVLAIYFSPGTLIELSAIMTWPRHPVYRTGQETGILKFGPKKKQETGQVFFGSIFQTGNRTGL